MFEALSGMRQELRSLLAATAADVPAQLAAFEGAVRSGAAIGARGERREASRADRYLRAMCAQVMLYGVR
ncbi:hypothetical protein [Streptomyces acidicola]|uniref:hypothetical protein n=1 Tax=Streptomyces acidicola TaxID=2596892 RepID=UPI00382F0BF1